MIKPYLAYFLLTSCLEASTFTLGFANYDSLTINASALSINGSYFDIVATGTTNVGPIVFGTFSYNTINPVNPPLTTSLLSSFTLNGSTIVPQSLYGFNDSLSNFTLGQSQTQNNLAFQETTSNQTSLKQVSCALSNGAILNGVVSVQNNPQGTFSQISFNNPSSDYLVYSYLIDTQIAGTYIMLNAGTKKGFSPSSWVVGNHNANPQTLYSINTNKGVVNIWNQNFYNQPGVAYATFYNNHVSLPKQLTDQQTTGIDFFISNQPSPYVFFSKQTYLGPNLNAVYVPISGNIQTFSQKMQNYNYSPYQGAGITQDNLGNLYVLFNGTSQAYLTPFNTTTQEFSSTLQAPQTMYSYTELYEGSAYQDGLVLTSLNSPSGPTYDYNCCFFNPSNQTFSQNFLISNYTATIGTTVSGTIIYTSTPQPDFVIDNSDNIIFVFSAQTNTGLYQLFSNVYSSQTQNLLGQNFISQSPNPMGSPLLLTNGTNTYLIWSQYNGTNYQIFNSTYSTTTKTFSAPSTLNFNFSTNPQIIKNPLDPLGFIFAGSN